MGVEAPVLGIAESYLFFAWLTAMLFVLCYLLALRINHFSIVDSVWAFAIGLGIASTAVFSPGDPLSKSLIVVAISVWSLRLGIFLAIRIGSHLSHEDARYQKLRQEYGERYLIRFALFYLYQWLSVLVIGLPFVFALRTVEQPGPLQWIGFLVVLLAVGGESIADFQKSRFRSNPENKTRVCDVGLWSRSRHPNYFFESWVWIGMLAVSVRSGGDLWMAYLPMLMAFLLLKVTGIPMAEEQSKLRYGAAFEDYCKRTPQFLPRLTRSSKI